ncbi:hypothetical protein QSI_0428 [Clostridioides difficile P28]|nr:hypothetical protein QSI_0428 [Clostridioides difficile P28]
MHYRRTTAKFTACSLMLYHIPVQKRKKRSIDLQNRRTI